MPNVTKKMAVAAAVLGGAWLAAFQGDNAVPQPERIASAEMPANRPMRNLLSAEDVRGTPFWVTIIDRE